MLSIGDRRVSIVVIALPLLFFVLLLVLAVRSSNDELEGTSWQVDQLAVDGSLAPAVEGVSVTVSFDDGSVTGSGGCNNYFGAYEADDGSLAFGDLGATQAICDDELGTSDQELVYFTHLGSVDRYRIDDGRLILSEGSTDLVVFSAIDS